jgi:hypothetical protein
MAWPTRRSAISTPTIDRTAIKHAVFKRLGAATEVKQAGRFPASTAFFRD